MTDPNYTHLTLVVDRSGSMTSIADDMNGGIDRLLSDQRKLDGKLLVDVFTFDDMVEALFLDTKAVNVVGPFVNPRGSTALFDAVGTAVQSLGERLAKLDEDERPGKVIVVVVTDGGENASKEWTDKAALQALVKKQQDEFSWDFIFLGANIDAAAVGGSFGVAQASSLGYDATPDGAVFATRSVSNYLTARRGGDADTTLADIGASTFSV